MTGAYMPRLPPCSTPFSSGPSAWAQRLSLRPSQNRNGAQAALSTDIVPRGASPMPRPPPRRAGVAPEALLAPAREQDRCVGGAEHRHRAARRFADAASASQAIGEGQLRLVARGARHLAVHAEAGLE